jgi:NET1-associated nuclear protein 1 (U3 small nucleolar RNA-associated protein 17)
VRLWDFVDGVLLKTWDVERRVAAMAVPSGKPNVVFVVCIRNKSDESDAAESKADRTGRVIRLDLKNKQPARELFKVLRLVAALHGPRRELACQLLTCCGSHRLESGICTHMASETAFSVQVRDKCVIVCSADGGIVAANCRCNLFVWSTAQRSLRRYTHETALTTLALHPELKCIATGDRGGEIVLWYDCVATDSADMDVDGEASPRNEPVKQRMHWHSHAVRSLCFTDDGAYLLSGGEEAVLVIWQLESGKKDFIPRLGAPLESISTSPDRRHYALSCADNTVRMLNAASLKVDVTLQGCKIAHACAPMRTSLVGLVVEGRAQSVVMNATESSLQFYDTRGGKHVAEILVNPRSAVSRMNEKRAAVIRVERVCFSADGMDMITVERLADGKSAEVVVMKFWGYAEAEATFVVNTQVSMPHKTIVTALQHHPTRPIVVSTSHDRRFKLWEKLTDRSVTALKAADRPAGADSADRVYWRCLSAGMYREFMLNDAAFSDDGSVLAIAASQYVTLWSPETSLLLTTLCAFPPHEPVRSMAFVDRSRYLVAFSDHRLVVFSTLTSQVWWACSLAACALAAQPASAVFAVAVGAQPAEPGFVLLFDPSSPEPIARFSLGDTSATAMTFVPTRAKTMAVLCLTTDHRLVTFERDGRASSKSGAAAEEPTALTDAATTPTPLESMYGAATGRSADKRTKTPPVAVAAGGAKPTAKQQPVCRRSNPPASV